MMSHRSKKKTSKSGSSTNNSSEVPVLTGVKMDSLGFQAMESNVPGLSQVILQKLNMKNYDDYRSALDGKTPCTDFGIRSYFEMFQKMEDTFKFCVECKKLPDSLPDPRSLRRCKRCQNVYYCGSNCQRLNWPIHKKFCKKLKLAAVDRLTEWLVFTGDIPFHTSAWTKNIQDLQGWEDWFLMQEHLDEKLSAIKSGHYMSILWATAGKPKPNEMELNESIKRVTTDFVSRPITVGFGLSMFHLNPYAKPITVHVIGASHVETLNARVTDYDELSQMFPKHQGIEVVMVGLDVVDGPIMRPPLVAFGPRQRVYLSSYKDLYHNFWESQVETQQAARPDLVVAFHAETARVLILSSLTSILERELWQRFSTLATLKMCGPTPTIPQPAVKDCQGFHACPDLMESWLPTLLLLRDYKIPSLFTTYSEQELKQSLRILMELETQIITCGANPFASLKPEQAHSNPNKPPVYANSHYLTFQGLGSPPEEHDLGELEGEPGERSQQASSSTT